MAGRFQFESPGANFTGEITKMLSQRKAEERQRLLDSLSFSADTRAQEAAQREKGESEARLARQKEQDAIARVQLLTGNMNPGDDPAERGASPDDIETGRKLGFFEKKLTPSVSSSITDIATEDGQTPVDFKPESATPIPAAPSKPSYGYVGSEKDRLHNRQVASTATLIQGLLNSGVPEKVEHGQLLAQFAAANDNVLPDSAFQYMTPNPHLRVWNDSTGKSIDGGAIGHNDKVIEQGYPPRELQQRQWLPGGLSANDEVQYINPADKSVVVVPGSHQAGRGTDKQLNSLGIAQDAYNDYGDTLQLLTPDKFGKVPAGNMISIRQAANRMITSSGVPDKVKSLALLFVNDNPSYNKYLEAHVGKPALSAVEMDKLEQLLGAIATPEVAQMYNLNPVVPFEKPEAPKRRLWSRN
jgi:hypothetical protein